MPTASPLTSDERECEQHFVETHRRLPSGHYMVRLPFKVRPPIPIGESFSCAFSCLRKIDRRLTSDLALYREYNAFLTEYEALGHMQLIREAVADEDASSAVYIPSPRY